MIADDTNAIRDGMRKLAQAKVIAEAEAAKRAEADSKPTELRKPGELFPEAGAPFRGFFLGEDGDMVAIADPEALDAHRRWMEGLGAMMIDSGFIQNLQVGDIRTSDPWDNVTLDGGSYMWGQL